MQCRVVEPNCDVGAGCPLESEGAPAGIDDAKPAYVNDALEQVSQQHSIACNRGRGGDGSSAGAGPRPALLTGRAIGSAQVGLSVIFVAQAQRVDAFGLHSSFFRRL